VDGALAPPMTSFIASKAFSRSVDATSAYDDHGGRCLSQWRDHPHVAAVDRALKGSMAGERMN
jgi:hypothetical protein